MKKLFSILLLSGNALLLSAQYNSIGLYNPHFTFNKAELIPSKLGDNSSRFEMRILPNFSVYSGNSLMSIEDILYPNTEKIDNAVLNNNSESTIFGAGVELPFLAFSYKVNKNEKELFTFSLSNRTRAGANLLLGSNFLRLIWRGNKQFEGESVDLGKFGVTTLGATEINLGLAAPFLVKDKLNVRAGANIKYILSTGGIHLPETSTLFETGVDGTFILAENLNYSIDLSTPDDNVFITGKGFGIDLGVTAKLDETTSLSMSLLDIGSISYTENTKSFKFSNDFLFEGVIIDNIFDLSAVEPDSAFVESLKTNEDSNQVFSISLPTRLVVQWEKNFMSKTKKRGKEYIKHGIYLTYIQGFNNSVGATKRPYFSSGYSYSLNNVVNIGPTINLGGYGGFGMGMMFSLRAGAFRLGVGTNTGLSYLLTPSANKRVDASFSTTWSFGGGNKKIKKQKEEEKDPEYTPEKEEKEKERRKANKKSSKKEEEDKSNDKE